MAVMSGVPISFLLAVAVIAIIIIIFFTVLGGSTPFDIFDLFQGLFKSVALFFIQQLHTILR